jgi:hypothetical protein
MTTRVFLGVLFGLLLAVGLAAQRQERIGDGVLLHVLPPDQIPAIDRPEFVSAAEGNKFMAEDEPVLGVFDGQVAKAYSLWLLDAHEIVNDSTPGLGPIAVTW